jgi:hypothetical protein
MMRSGTERSEEVVFAFVEALACFLRPPATSMQNQSVARRRTPIRDYILEFFRNLSSR